MTIFSRFSLIAALVSSALALASCDEEYSFKSNGEAVNPGTNEGNQNIPDGETGKEPEVNGENGGSGTQPGNNGGNNGNNGENEGTGNNGENNGNNGENGGDLCNSIEDCCDESKKCEGEICQNIQCEPCDSAPETTCPVVQLGYCSDETRDNKCVCNIQNDGSTKYGKCTGDSCNGDDCNENTGNGEGNEDCSEDGVNKPTGTPCGDNIMGKCYEGVCHHVVDDCGDCTKIGDDVCFCPSNNDIYPNRICKKNDDGNFVIEKECKEAVGNDDACIKFNQGYLCTLPPDDECNDVNWFKPCKTAPNIDTNDGLCYQGVCRFIKSGSDGCRFPNYLYYNSSGYKVLRACIPSSKSDQLTTIAHCSDMYNCCAVGGQDFTPCEKIDGKTTKRCKSLAGLNDYKVTETVECIEVTSVCHGYNNYICEDNDNPSNYGVCQSGRCYIKAKEENGELILGCKNGGNWINEGQDCGDGRVCSYGVCRTKCNQDNTCGSQNVCDTHSNACLSCNECININNPSCIINSIDENNGLKCGENMYCTNTSDSTYHCESFSSATQKFCPKGLHFWICSSGSCGSSWSSRCN